MFPSSQRKRKGCGRDGTGPTAPQYGGGNDSNGRGSVPFAVTAAVDYSRASAQRFVAAGGASGDFFAAANDFTPIAPAGGFERSRVSKYSRVDADYRPDDGEQQRQCCEFFAAFGQHSPSCPMRYCVTAVVSCPIRSAGTIIGDGGRVLREMRRLSGCNIQELRSTDGIRPAEFSVSGTRAGCDEVRKWIERIAAGGHDAHRSTDRWTNQSTNQLTNQFTNQSLQCVASRDGDSFAFASQGAMAVVSPSPIPTLILPVWPASDGTVPSRIGGASTSAAPAPAVAIAATPGGYGRDFRPPPVMMMPAWSASGSVAATAATGGNGGGGDEARGTRLRTKATAGAVGELTSTSSSSPIWPALLVSTAVSRSTAATAAGAGEDMRVARARTTTTTSPSLHGLPLFPVSNVSGRPNTASVATTFGGDGEKKRVAKPRAKAAAGGGEIASPSSLRRCRTIVVDIFDERNGKSPPVHRNRRFKRLLPGKRR